MFQIDLLSRTPIYEQLYQNIAAFILNGVLSENEQLPSVRALAKQLSVNPNTVQKAYQELERNHFIYTVSGRGNFVAKVNRNEMTKKALENVRVAVQEACKSGITIEEIIQMINEME